MFFWVAPFLRASNDWGRPIRVLSSEFLNYPPQGEKTTMKKVIVALAVLVQSVAFAQLDRPKIYIEPQAGFETYIAAALTKKHVPVDVITDKTKATYILTAAPVETKSESTGSKITRCLFLYCAGIEDRSNVSVQLIASSSSKVLWAYTVVKQNGGHNEQSMAEAVAKHLKQFLEK
jgi:hypothetical protein